MNPIQPDAIGGKIGTDFGFTLRPRSFIEVGSLGWTGVTWAYQRKCHIIIIASLWLDQARIDHFRKAIWSNVTFRLGYLLLEQPCWGRNKIFGSKPHTNGLLLVQSYLAYTRYVRWALLTCIEPNRSTLHSFWPSNKWLDVQETFRRTRQGKDVLWDQTWTTSEKVDFVPKKR